MTTEDKFRAAVNVIRSLPKNGSYQPSHELMLRFYGFFKQATEGPCKASRPAFWEVVKKMKWEAWSKLGNMSREEAMNSYVEELKKIVETMSYTDNVASFLGSLGSFYDNVPPEDVELLIGPIIERMRSQPGSPLNGSPFASREASPDRLQSVLNGRNHITSSLETSPASSYSASPLPPDGEEDEEEEEFIDTVETEPDRIVKDTTSVTKASVPSKKPSLANGIPNGHISTPVVNGVNGHQEDNVTVNNSHLPSHERGRPRGRVSVTLNQPNASPFNARAVEFEPEQDSREQGAGPQLAHNIFEPITETVEQLQRDLERVTGRLRELETALSARTAQMQPKTTYPSWWPFKDISPRLVVFLVAWPFVVNATIALIQRRRNNRLM